MDYSIKVFKQYFNFACSHFLIFPDGTREPLHGHNYRVSVTGRTTQLSNDMVFDFLDIKPIVREVCNSLDHRLLLPGENSQVKISELNANWEYRTPDGSFFSFPKKDVIILPLPNISAERLATYISEQVAAKTWEKFNFKFRELEIEIEETPGQSAAYTIKDELYAF